MQRWPAEPYAGRGDRVGGDVDVGVGHHDGVVLRAAERLHALAVRRRRLVDVLRDRRRADERDRRDAGVREQRLDRLAVAVHDVERAVRQARPRRASSAISSDADGSFSLGLRMNAFPHASASGNIHIGTIAGKLNGVMPTAHAERLAQRVRVDAGADRLGRLALEQVRGAAGELDDLEAALDLAARVVDRLAVLGGDHARELAGVGGEQLAEREQHVRAAGRATARSTPRSRPSRPRPRGRRRRCSRTPRAA